MQTILDGGGVRIGSVPAFIDIDTHENKNVVIVGASGSGKTTFAKNLLRGILKQDIPVIACIIEPAGEHTKEIRDAGLSVLSLYGNKRTGTTDGMLEDSEMERAMRKHPRMAFHINTRHAVAGQVAGALNHMKGMPPETRKIIVVDDATPDNIPIDMAGLENTTVVIITQYLTWSEWLLEYSKQTHTRVALGSRDGWSEVTLDALRISKSDLEGLDRHKALVAVGNKKAIVEVPG